jgi:hypothetical protein
MNKIPYLLVSGLVAIAISNHPAGAARTGDVSVGATTGLKGDLARPFVIDDLAHSQETLDYLDPLKAASRVFQEHCAKIEGGSVKPYQTSPAELLYQASLGHNGKFVHSIVQPTGQTYLIKAEPSIGFNELGQHRSLVFEVKDTKGDGYRVAIISSTKELFDSSSRFVSVEFRKNQAYDRAGNLVQDPAGYITKGLDSLAQEGPNRLKLEEDPAYIGVLQGLVSAKGTSGTSIRYMAYDRIRCMQHKGI